MDRPISRTLRSARATAVAALTAYVCATGAALATTFVVNSALDAIDSFAGDGICDTANDPRTDPPTPPSGLCTLRAALEQAEADPGASSIFFTLSPGSSIRPTRNLPHWSGPGVIDASANPVFAGTPLVALDGSAIVTFNGVGLSLGSDITVRGLIVNRFSEVGMRITGDSNRIAGCWIGTDATGTNPAGNGLAVSGIGGIQILGGSSNLIGGTDHDPGTCNRDCNLISANGNSGVQIEAFFAPARASDNRVFGNFIGTDITGSTSGDLDASLGNRIGVAIVGSGASRNTIGTVDESGSGRNVIGGSAFNHVRIDSANDNEVSSNWLGTGATGLARLGSGFSGIFLVGAARNRISENLIGASGTFGISLAVSNNNDLSRNTIGLNGRTALPNAGGILVEGNDNDIEENVVSASSGVGGPVFTGELGHGLQIIGNGNDAYRNRFGTDRTGLVSDPDGVAGSGDELGNALDGVRVAGNDNCIGTLKEFTGRNDPKCQVTAVNLSLINKNVIAANGRHGIAIVGGARNIVLANTIGLAADHVVGLANAGNGIDVSGSSTETDIRENVIAGNALHGVRIGTSNNRVRQNRIGTDPTDRAGLGNGLDGVRIADGAGNVVGGPPAISSEPVPNNVISGNLGNGVSVARTADTEVLENYIGLTSNGQNALGNARHGLVLADSTKARVDGNTISANAGGGIRIERGSGHAATRNVVGLNVLDPAAGIGPVRRGNLGDGVTLIDSNDNLIGQSNRPPPGVLASARNTISANAAAGIRVLGGMGNTIGHNRIGVHPDTSSATPDLGNAASGVTVHSTSAVAGATGLEIIGNTLGNNGGNGIALVARRDAANNVIGTASAVEITFNQIGTSGCTLGGTVPSVAVPNGREGLLAMSGANRNEAISNCIWTNSADGVVVNGVETVRNRLSRNSIRANTLAAIVTRAGGNLELTPPALTVLNRGGFVQGTACADCRIEIFHDDDAEAEVFVAAVNADASGRFQLTGTPLPRDRDITCTATDANGNTSALGCGLDQAVGIVATKVDADLDAGLLQPGDRLRYTIRVANDGGIDIADGPGDELRDAIPPGAAYAAGSLLVNGLPEDDDPEDGTGFDATNNRVVFNGLIPARDALVLTFDVVLDSELAPDSRISNQALGLLALMTDDPATPELADPTVSVLGTTSTMVLEIPFGTDEAAIAVVVSGVRIEIPPAPGASPEERAGALAAAINASALLGGSVFAQAAGNRLQLIGGGFESVELPEVSGVESIPTMRVFQLALLAVLMALVGWWRSRFRALAGTP